MKYNFTVDVADFLAMDRGCASDSIWLCYRIFTWFLHTPCYYFILWGRVLINAFLFLILPTYYTIAGTNNPVRSNMPAAIFSPLCSYVPPPPPFLHSSYPPLPSTLPLLSSHLFPLFRLTSFPGAVSPNTSNYQ